MEELLQSFEGKKIDVTCGSSAVFRGEVVEVGEGVLKLRDEDGKLLYIAIPRIASVYECSDQAGRPGFIN
jgi:hypothetical protein